MEHKVAENPSKNRKQDTPLLILAALMTTIYIASNILSVKVLQIGGVSLFDLGTLTFPLTYLIGNVLAEIWGKKVTRQIIFLTFGCNVFFMLLMLAGAMLPTPAYMQETDEAFHTIFFYVPRIVFASLLSFIVGEMLNMQVLLHIRHYTGRSLLWLRTIGSSALGYLVDTVLFMLLAFAGTVPMQELLFMIGVQYLFKLLIEVILNTPMAYALVGWLKIHGGYRN